MSASLRVVPPAFPPPPPGWMWDGTQWVCDPCDQRPFPCPPPGFPTPCPPWFPPPANQAPWYPGANGGVSFSATPPANPIRGNFWWDGMVLHLFDGAAWVDIGPGAAGSGGAFVGTNPPANPAVGALWWNGTVLQVWDGSAWQAGQATVETFAITMTSNLAIPAGSASFTVVPFNTTPIIDTQSAFDPATRRYMPKIAGSYAFFARGLFNTTGPGTAGIAIAKNDPGTFVSTAGDLCVGISTHYDPTLVSGWQTCGGIATMNGTTDYIRMFALITPGGNLLAGGVSPVLVGWKLP